MGALVVQGHADRLVKRDGLAELAAGVGRMVLAGYRRLFTQALIGWEQTEEGFGFRFRAAPGLEAWVRDVRGI